MPLMQLLFRLTPGAVNHHTPFDRRPVGNGIRPAQYMGVAIGFQEFSGVIDLVLNQPAIPGPNGHIGDAVLVTGDIGPLGQGAIEQIELALDLTEGTVIRLVDTPSVPPK